MEYSKHCDKTEREQIEVVAQFHAHRIRAERIAYRTGIERAFIEQLLSGEYKPQLFARLLAGFRAQRRNQRLIAASRARKGTARLSAEQRAEGDYSKELKLR